MDIQRSGLLAMVGILTYILFLQWNNYSEQAVKTERSQPVITSTRTDAPQIIDPLTNSQISTQTVQISTNPNDETTVNVSTPLFDITIDLVGGDITQALLKKFPKTLGRPDDPISLLENREHTYIAQSGLVGPDGPDASVDGRPIYLSQNVNYEISELTQVILQTQTDKGLLVQKIYEFTPDRYDIKLIQRVTNNGDSTKTVIPFVQLKRDNSPDPSIQNSMGMKAFLGFALKTADERYKKVTFTDFETTADAKELNSELKIKTVGLEGGYLALLQHYFTTAWIPSPTNTNSYTFRKNDQGENIGSIISPNQTVESGKTVDSITTLYIGPKDQEALEALTPGLELVVDYGWLWFICQPLFWLLKFIQTYVVNWGLAIILVTVLVKGAFFQLSAAAYRSMAKMRKFTPEIAKLKELYGDDRQRMSKEMMDLYKREKINPLGGCLPIVVQMPVFISLYWVLLESVELRQAPFILWIVDLSTKDPYFILPLLMGVSMFIQTSLNPTPPDPMQAKIMKYMPVAFTFFFLWFPAGLVLYWVVNNILSICQQWVITKGIEKNHSSS
jgi:YidC/Oxa1 family membrane protein insertase|tara:strand:+ start:942 stop:2621 length:1680 start_codon:yes stop_codon:yes gene_type:complete